MRGTVKVALTFLLGVLQLTALAVLLVGMAAAAREFLGDNDDGTFTPTLPRRIQAVTMLAGCLAIAGGVMYATIRVLLGMWSKRAAAPLPENQTAAPTKVPGSDRVPRGTSNRDLWRRRRG